MRPILLSALVLLSACSGSDPRSLSSEGYALLGKGDAKRALVKFEAALEGLDTVHPEYLRASIGRCEALSRTDGAAARKDFLELAAKIPAKIGEDDYSLICSALLQGGFTLEAIDVMDVGNKRFVGSKKMEETLAAVMSAAKRAKTPEALNKLKGLGYAGD